MKGFQSCLVLNWLAHTSPLVLLFSAQYCGLEGCPTNVILQKVLGFDTLRSTCKACTVFTARCVPTENAVTEAGRDCGKHLQLLVILLSSYVDNKVAGQEFNFFVSCFI